MKRIIIMHGWNATPHEAWFSDAADMLRKKGYQVEVPELPGGYYPDFDGWMKTIRDLAPDENTILIGHSLGAVTIMRFLESQNIVVNKTILTAMPIEPMKFTPISPFFEDDFDWEKIKTKAQKIVLIYEEGDQVVPLEHGEIAAEKLCAPLMIVTGFNHLNTLDISLLEKIVENE